jgi:uncharacterized protein (TIGR00269 family)
MKCRKCENKASIHMRQHKLALCKEHYLEWVPEQTARFIKKYEMFTPDEKILVAVSGGKDSLSLWDILVRLGYQLMVCISVSALTGINYSRVPGLRKIHKNNLKLHVVDIEKEYGQSIPVLADISHRGHGKPCAVCGLAKRHEMNRIARDLGYDVLATGHNLDDEAAVLFGNTLKWSSEYLLRQGPVLPGSGLARKVKPLCRFYEREMTAYAISRGIDYIYDECPFADGSQSIFYKESLNLLETARPGAKLIFYLSFLEAKKSGNLFIEKNVRQSQLHPCPKCGQPTSTPDFCSFCRMIEKAQKKVRCCDAFLFLAETACK